MAYIHKESTILVNPLEGLRVEEGPLKGMIQSPSLGFIHECIHGMHHLENPDIYINKLNPKASIEGEYGNKYRTLEEWITVIIERRIASQLGESLRYSSKGVSVLVKSPISKEELK